jgi:hypothetical protein
MPLRLDRTIICCAAACVCGTMSMTGCAMMGSMRPAADSYTYDVGIASANEIRNRTASILKTFGYDVVRDDPDHVYLETEWLKRAPVDDPERSRGTEIISRVKLTGSQDGRASTPGTYHVLVTVENRFVPTRGTRRDVRDMTSSISYAQSIVKGMSLAFGGTARPVADEPRPF